MSWNKPGGDDKDPWSGRDEQNEPPDLDEAIRSLQKKLGSLFGANDGDADDNSGNAENGSESEGLKIMGILAAGATVLWLASGFYIVDENNQGVVSQFGKYITTKQAGSNWNLPAPMGQVEIVDMKKQRYLEIGFRNNNDKSKTEPVPAKSESVLPKELLMLTQDQNLVEIRFSVQYQVKNAEQFVKMVNPEQTLMQVTESVEREVIGNKTMTAVLTTGHSEIGREIKQNIQTVMDSYSSGIEIVNVNLHDVQLPKQLQAAFAETTKAQAERQHLLTEAQTYADDVVSKTAIITTRKKQEAEAYKEQVIAQAEGEVSRFSQLLNEYKKAPEITRQRLYIETMESVLSKSNTVMVDTKSNNLVLPLDKMMLQAVATGETETPKVTVSVPTPTAAVDKKVPEPALRISPRGREDRGRE